MSEIIKKPSIYTAFPRGYCAWVDRAVGMLMEIIEKFPSPIFVNHQIIHNRFVVAMFERKWVIFESNLENIPDGSLLVISAHGTWPSYFQALKQKNIRWIDATCPLVDKVHKEAKKYIKEGYHILYIGKKWHQEAVGVIDEGEKYFTLIEKREDLKKVIVSWPLALLTQTTLSVDETEEIIQEAKRMFPQIVLPNSSDICYATTNRQNAVKELAQYCDTVIVVGSKNSSNSNKLKQVALELWKRAHLIDDAREIESDWIYTSDSIWVTAGASGPEELVKWVIEVIESMGWTFVREIRVTDEKMEFPYVIKVQGE